MPTAAAGWSPRWGMIAVPRRFQFKVYPRGDCWEWRGHRTPFGYGIFCLEGRDVPAHRVAYELAKGPIPSALEIDHLCRHPWCVKPSHLEAVTPRVNARRSNAVSGVNFRKTRCKRGHPLTPDNITITSAGSRRCMICTNELAALYRARNRERLRIYHRAWSAAHRSED